MARTFSWFFGASKPNSTSRPRNCYRRERLSIELLEARQMMHGAGLDDHNSTPPEPPPTAYAFVQSIDPAAGQAGANSAGVGVTGAVSAAIKNAVLAPIVFTDQMRDQQMGTPLLDSNPGAPATLYLDFNGNFESDWFILNGDGSQQHFKNITTPTFDTDGDPTRFSAAEQATIKEIWQRVSEDYAPFNINVSTDYYGSFNNGQAVHVVIGGSNNDWLKQNASGISSIGSFHDAAPNTVFVFDLMAWARDGDTDGEGHLLNGVAAIANTASHEAGHSFGLLHHSLYNVDGDKMFEYDPGTSGWTPIMGNNLAADRTTWDADPTDLGPNTNQRDLDVISSAANGFGFRPDDHGNTQATADALTSGPSVLSPLTGKGIIGNMFDVDAFKFTTAAGTLKIVVNAAPFGPNLIPIAQLWSGSKLISNANAGGLTQSIINVNVPAGTYYVLVKSFGDYGDLGQYTVSVTTPLVYQGTISTVTYASAVTITAPPADALNPAVINANASTGQPTKLATTTFGSPKGLGSTGPTELVANLLLPTLPLDLKPTDRNSLLTLSRVDHAIFDAIYQEFGAS